MMNNQLPREENQREKQLQPAAGSYILALPSSALKLIRPSFFGGIRETPPKEGYPSVLFPLGLHGVQAFHEAGDALLQAVDGVVLRVVATEAVAQAAEGIPNKLQVAALWAETGCCWHGTLPFINHIPAAGLKKIQGRGFQKRSFIFEGGGVNCRKFSSTDTSPPFAH